MEVIVPSCQGFDWGSLPTRSLLKFRWTAVQSPFKAFPLDLREFFSLVLSKLKQQNHSLIILSKLRLSRFVASKLKLLIFAQMSHGFSPFAWFKTLPFGVDCCFKQCLRFAAGLAS
jgi:hypothetical protein